MIGMSFKGCSLTSTPSSREWQPGTTGNGLGWKVMLLKSTNQICQGALECFQWKFATRSGAWMLSQDSQELCSILNPSHLMRYHNFQLTTLLSRIYSTTHSSSPSMISGSGGGWGHRPCIGSSGTGVSLTMLKTGCNLLIEGGRQSRYVPFPTFLTMVSGPSLLWVSFWEGLVIWISLASKYTLSPGWKSPPVVIVLGHFIFGFG